MVCFTRSCVVALLLWVGGLQLACVTGKAFEGARLDESPETLHAACVYEGKLRVHYTAVVTREFGEIVGRRERGAEIGVADLEARPRRQVDRIEVVSIDPEEATRPESCVPVSVRVPGLEGNAAASRADGSVLELPAPVLHRDDTAGWVWPLLPVTLALDVVATPSLVVLWVVYYGTTD